MSNKGEMIYEHKSGARLKLEQEPIKLIRTTQWQINPKSWKWVLSVSRPNTKYFSTIGEFRSTSKHKHMKEFELAREALDHVSFANC